MTEEFKRRLRLLSSGLAQGFRAHDGRFEASGDGHRWVIFEEPNDTVYWCPFDGAIATDEGRAFALNETAIESAGTYCLDDSLIIHPTVSAWVLSGGKGIYVLDWRQAFDKLRNAPRIEVPEALLHTYKCSMEPRRPVVRVNRSHQARRAAA